jgi:ABC-type transporter Mla maintaining outer membrane lipid asymmetry ATPase subunit MlaF
VSEPVVDITGVTKQYGALRPLRVERLRLAAGEQLALLGLDQPAAEVFISLLTGATLPDTGSVAIFGQPTHEIANSDAWLASLDRFGIVSDRAAILESMTVVQNLAMPFTLDIEPPPDDVRVRAEGLAREAGIEEAAWHRPCHGLPAGERFRLRLARALALEPMLLLLEHPSASLARGEVASIARAVRSIVERRQLAVLMLTMDREWAFAAAPRMLTLEPATGRLKEGLLSRMGFRS